MKYYLLPILLFFGLAAKPQTPTPDEFLGYPLGSSFTSHLKVVDYFKKVAATNTKVKLQTYGYTYEGKELILAIISDSVNMMKLVQIRKNNLALAQADKNASIKQPSILWLSYNVHGNEASSAEAAMKVLYALAEAKGEVKQWLKNVVVIIDPCLNPDGRERYVNYYNSVKGIFPNADPAAREHNEPWPGGRTNHYYFDLNRDWAWQTQIETKQRLVFYQNWMPQVHVDFHEQSYNEPYYFAPSAEPVHQSITPWQRGFQQLVYNNNVKYFEEHHWKYSTTKRFDLLYPSYGDTYPLFNGAVGMTYEESGIAAGLVIGIAAGDTLTLKDRIDHHFATSMATLETVSANASKLVLEFKNYFLQSKIKAFGNYEAFVVKAQHLYRLSKMAELLRKNHVEFSFGGDKSMIGYSYKSQQTEKFRLERNDLIINLHQAKSILANVLFEPHTFVTDSNTYDITAWALPYIYGLPAYAVKQNLQGKFSMLLDQKEPINSVKKPVAWIIPWQSLADVKMLMALQESAVKIRIADKGFAFGKKFYCAGTLLVFAEENSSNLTLIKNKSDRFINRIYPTSLLDVENNKNFKPYFFRLLSKPKIAIVSGPEVSAQAMGEVWYYLDQDLHSQSLICNTQNISSLDIHQTNVLIIPNGDYAPDFKEKLTNWVAAGGKLILLEGAIAAFVAGKRFEIKPKAPQIKIDDYLLNDGILHKKSFQNAILGAIYKINLNQSNAISFGLGDDYYALKTDDHNYELLKNGTNLGVLEPNSYVSGIAGQATRAKLTFGMQIGMQQIGKGNVIYFAFDPLFRMFLESGKQIFNNALFLL